jgi:hypothetical protein
MMKLLNPTKAVDKTRKVKSMSKFIKFTILSLTFALLIVFKASAQTVAIGELTGPVDLSDPANITARISRLAGDTGREAIDKYLQGTVQIVPGVDGQGPQAAIEWFGLSSGAGGGDTIALSPPMTTMHQPESATLPGGLEMDVAGDIEALVRAARTVAENAVPGEQTETEQSDENSDSNSDSSVANAGAGTPLETDEAQLPTIQGVTDTETVESVVNNDVFGETAAGCLAVLADDEQSMIIYKAPTTNGVASGECAPSSDRPAIQSTHVGCSYDTTSVSGKAYAKKRRYYVYAGSTTDVDTTCITDDSVGYLIVETIDECSVHPNLQTMTAKQYTRLVFTGRENETVMISTCAARNGDSFAINKQLCSYRDDFNAKRTFETDISTYVGSDGLKRNIGNCTDTGNFYTHNFDTSVCGQLADFTNNKLYDQYRIRIDLPTGPSFRTPTCKPFAEELTALQETQSGCESFHRDYAGFSLGGKRIVRTDNQQQIRECREADVNYPHVYVAEGWVRDDANVRATAKDATYIDLPQPAGRTLIAAAVIRAGTQPTNYVFERAYSETGNDDYVENSCNKYILQNKMEDWRRPDASLFKRQNGFNTPVGPTNACTLQVTASWPRISAQTLHLGGGPGAGCSNNGSADNPVHADAVYEGSKTLTREDNVTISTTTVQKTLEGCSTYCRPSGGGYSGASFCPTSQSGSQVITWRNELGWW